MSSYATWILLYRGTHIPYLPLTPGSVRMGAVQAETEGCLFIPTLGQLRRETHGNRTRQVTREDLSSSSLRPH